PRGSLQVHVRHVAISGKKVFHVALSDVHGQVAHIYACGHDCLGAVNSITLISSREPCIYG
ncbi:hypothetical protein NGA_2086620, partial [Nannochloropsis gaditana CCMP526]|uniref:uncharacterized protein n=1 Tax=Nannochloropsis gaditana (strain CCMP526) TaxID=1093141 RepID=UPI00029F60BA